MRKKLAGEIEAILPSLRKNQKRVAEYFLDHMDLVALSPIGDIAKVAGVSQASIVRFAQLLGYSGYKQLRDAISSSLKKELSPTQRYQNEIIHSEKIPDLLKTIATNVIHNINDTIHTINQQDFSAMVDSIIAARQIYCLGLELSYHLSSLMTFQLRLYGYDAQTLSPAFLRYKEQISYLKPQDLILAFSFSPYSRETVEALAYAEERGLTTVAITDRKVAPVLEYVKHSVQVRTDNITFSNSLGAVAVVINSIIAELNYRDRERTLNALRIIDENIKDDRYFII